MTNDHKLETMISKIKEIGPVRFPANTGERVYMLPFTKRAGLPSQLARWQPTVDAMLQGVNVDGPIYIMIDQGTVKAGSMHRRGGAHIDGNWNPGVSAHGGGGHNPGPTHGPWASHRSNGSTWHSANFTPEALILASDVSASCAYVGEIAGEPSEGGDCSHIDLSTALRVPLLAGRAYAGNVTMVHESLPVMRDTNRTLVRLNVPGYDF